MKTATYNIYSIEYNESGERFRKFLEKATIEKETEVLFLIEKGYLNPEDIAYVEIVETESGINIISSENVLIFVLEY
jgi:hypothetical protein